MEMFKEIGPSMVRFFQNNQVIILLILGAIYLWIQNFCRPHYVIKVQSDPAIFELTKIVQEQREKIDFMSNHPKVVFRCLDDEPKIKYPKHANDGLTKIVFDTSDECGNTAELDAIVIVHTAADHFKRRDRFRNTYSDYEKTKPYKLKVVFLIGHVRDANLQIDLEMENRQYGDTIIGGFLDTYQNLTVKAVMGYRWLAETCKGAKLLIKMDDDVFLNVRKFFGRYWNKVHKTKKERSIHCQVWQNAVVGRAGKWKVERGLFRNSSYPFPYCAGYLAVVTMDLVRPMYEHGKAADFFWIDDVFMYGMVPNEIGNVRFVQIGRSKHLISQIYESYKKCVTSKGLDKCPNFAVLTNGEDEFDTEYERLFFPQKNVTMNVTVPVQQIPAEIVDDSKLLSNISKK